MQFCWKRPFLVRISLTGFVNQYVACRRSAERSASCEIDKVGFAYLPVVLGGGIFVGGQVGLAHRHLIIVDLSSPGHQPTASADARMTRPRKPGPERYAPMFVNESLRIGLHSKIL
jgi:hypothetical protein